MKVPTVQYVFTAFSEKSFRYGLVLYYLFCLSMFTVGILHQKFVYVNRIYTNF
nr:MAG TPA: hypothetical protein [Caudoviricetes sp.]